MSLRHKLLLPTFVFGLWAMPALAEDPSTATVIATVNGVDITLGHMIAAKSSLPEQYRSLPDEVLFEGLLEQLIQQTVLSQSFGDSIPESAALAIENDSRTLLASRAIEQVTGEAVTEDAIAEAYAAQYAEADPTPEFDASHILVETEEEALALVEELEAGADFAELAREKSTGPSGPNGGALGWFGPGMMVPPFEEAVKTLEPGQVSGPVETQFGWHVVRLNDTRMKGAPELEEVRQELTLGIQQKAAEDFVTSLTEQSTITRADLEEITPDTLSTVTFQNEE